MKQRVQRYMVVNVCTEVHMLHSPQTNRDTSLIKIPQLYHIKHWYGYELDPIDRHRQPK